MTGQEEYPRFISNRPCGNDKYEGKSQELGRFRFQPDRSGKSETFCHQQQLLQELGLCSGHRHAHDHIFPAVHHAEQGSFRLFPGRDDDS